MKKLAHRSSALKKIIVTFLLSVGCFAGAAQAAPSATASLNNAYQSGQHLYVKAGYMAYFLNLPKFSPAISDDGINAPLMTKKFTHNLANTLTLALGYHFVNQSFLTSIFGTQNAIELSGDKFTYSSTKRKAGGTGRIWRIDTGAVLGTSEYVFTTTSLKTRVNFYQTALNWQGLKRLTRHVFMSPSLGLVYVGLNEKGETSAFYRTSSMAPTTDPLQDYEKYKLRTEYYGLQIGDQINYQATSYFAPYVSVNVEALHGYTKLKASQAPVNISAPTVIYTVSKTKRTVVDLRLTGLLGVKINFFRQPNLPYLNIYGGVDYWNWMPQASMPHGTGQVTRIKIRKAVNAMAGVELTVPFS
jgi:hypothetical protein